MDNQATQLFTEPVVEDLTFSQILEKYGLTTPEFIGNTGIPMGGINYQKNDGTNIFRIITTGTDVGDIIIGNYAGGQGIKWDQSANKTTFTGAITAGTITGVSITLSNETATYFKASATGVEALRTKTGMDAFIQLNTTSGVSIQGTSSSTVFPCELVFSSTADTLMTSLTRNKASATNNIFLLSGGASENSGTVPLAQYTSAGTAAYLSRFSVTGTNGTCINLISSSASNNANALDGVLAHNGSALYLELSKTDNNSALAYFKHGGTGITARFDQNKSDNTTYVLQTYQAAKTSTNFEKHLYIGTVTFWISNGTTPNGNLTGAAGDICLGADSGKAYYCTGGNSWTAM